MAGLLKRLRRRCSAYAKGGRGGAPVVLAVLILSVPTAFGADLPDPTRPPAAFTAPPPDQAAPKPPSVVNALYLTGAKPYALVDGIALQAGDPLGEGQVLRIDETGVWIKEAGQTRVLRLLPEVEKQASPSRLSASSPKAAAPIAEKKAGATPRARTRRSQ